MKFFLTNFNPYGPITWFLLYYYLFSSESYLLLLLTISLFPDIVARV